MKKLLYVLLAMTVAFAMIGCPTDSEDDPPPVVIPPTITSVTVSSGPAVILQGTTATYGATVLGTGAFSQTVVWSIAPKTSTPLASGTSINSGGLLTVDSSETSGTVIVVTATSDADSTKSDDIEVTVFDQASLPVAETVTVTPALISVTKGSTQQFTAEVTGTNISSGSYDGVRWSVNSSISTISATGLLTVPANETLNALTVTATAEALDADGDEVTGTAEVVVTAGVVSSVTITFTLFQGGPTVKEITLEPEVTIENGGRTLPRRPIRGNPGEYAFKQWTHPVYGTITTDSAFYDNATVYAEYYDGVFRNDDLERAEKVYLENQAFVVYEFDLSPLFDNTDTPAQKKAKAIAGVKAATGFKASYGLSEAAIAVGGGGARARVLGPYYFNGDIDKAIELQAAGGGNNAGDHFFGDFKSDPNGKATIRLDGTGSALETFNKWHAYMVYTSANANWTGWTGTIEESANTWWTQDYPFATEPSATIDFNTSNYQNTMSYYEDIYTDGTCNGVQILDFDSTDFTKVYFATGIARANAGSVVNTTDDIWLAGRVQLIRDVTLVTKKADDSVVEIIGVTPNLSIPAHNNATSGGSAVAMPATPAGSESQVFAAYINPVVGSWRGGVNNVIVTSNAPTWTPPEPLPDAPQHVIIDLAADPNLIKIYGNMTSTEISKTGGVVSVNVTTTDNGGGIYFELPDELLSEFSYDAIWIYYNCTYGDDIGSTAQQFASKSGQSSFGPNLNIGTNAWPTIEAGEAKRFTIPGTANLISNGNDGGIPDVRGISLQINNNAAGNLPQHYDITFTRIVLRAP
jgi:hypothetical protein